MDHLKVVLLSFCLFAGITATARRPERWLATATRQCSRVKVITNLTEDSLQHSIFYRILRYANVDEHRTSPRDIYTTEYQMEQYKYRFHYQLAGNTVIISGEYGAPGLGGTSWIPITRGRAPSTIGTPWEQMEVMTGGWHAVETLYSDH